MKKIYIFLIFALLTIHNTNARPVGSATARLVADTWMSAMGMKNTASLVDVTSQSPFTEFYLFASEAGGFILVSADDCVVPVLGYSVDNRFQVKEMPAHVHSFLEGYEREIRFYKELESQHPSAPSGQPSAVGRQWQMLTSGVMPPAPLATAVSSLMSTTWNQSPYYNIFCPYDANETETANSHIVTGCVATATAQVMKYHNHPATGYGSHSYTHSRYGTLSANFGNTTYQWTSMPNALNASSSEAQVNAVATLMYHIGVADEMYYNLTSNGGSGAFNYNSSGALDASSQTALMKHFKYRPDMAAIARDNYSDSEYCAILRAELDQSRPILYSGFGGGGHSFVLDGYNNAGQFHVNWGWGGNHDGFFTMGSLNPSGGGAGSNLSGTYNIDNAALIGIRPNPNWNTATTITTAIEGCPSATVSGAGTYAFGDTVTLAVFVPEGYRFARWNDYDRFNGRQLYANGGSYSFTALVEPVAGNIRSYCGAHCSYVSVANSSRWGIRLPASVLADGDTLSAVQFFVPSAGNYTLTVYTGTDAPDTAVYTNSHIFSYDDEERWKTFILSTPLVVDGSQNLWIVFNYSGSGYPVALTSSSGNPDGFLSGSSLTSSSLSGQYSLMIRGIFGNASASIDPADIIETADCSQPAALPYRLDANNPDFSNLINCWTFLDADGDGYNWFIDGSGFTSKSYSNQTNLTPDNWLISPPIGLPSGNSILLSLKDAAEDIRWPDDHYGIFISTSGTNPSDFTLLEGHTLSDTSWTERSLDLSAYAGQTVHIAFRHYNCSGVYIMHLKDIALTSIAALPYATGFESGDDMEWAFINGHNAWTLGQAASNGGTNGLYVSNDNGATNAYTNGASTTSFTTRTFSFESGEYAFSFDWRCNGEQNYDFLRVWVVPNNAVLNADEFPVESPITTGTPEGWVDLVGGQLSASSTWNTADGTFHIAADGIYKLVFCWKNDLSWGDNPPAAIDNVSISSLSCPSPTNLAVSEATPNSLSISWDAASATQWLVRLDGGEWQPVGTNSFTASGLATASAHTFDVRTLCASGDSSLVVSLSASTPCSAADLPFTETFNSTSATRQCWDLVSLNTANGLSTSNGMGFVTVSNRECLRFSSYSSADNYNQYGFSPLLNVPTGASGLHVSITFATRGATDLLWFGYVTPADTVWYPDTHTTSGESDFQTFQFDIPATATQVAIHYYGDFKYYAWIDQVDVQAVIDTTAPPVTNYYTVNVACDTTMGTVDGVPTEPVAEGTQLTLTAVPNAGYRFANWSTGATTPSITLTVDRDTLLTAFFQLRHFTLTVLSNDLARGFTHGSGTFTPFDTASAMAVALAGNAFLGWNDGSTDNPRSLLLQSDSSITALFASSDQPLPIHDTVTIDHYILDTVTLTDTLWQTEYLRDTIYIHDTAFVDHYILDTVTLTDTLWQTEYVRDTIYIHDTTIIDRFVHDTTLVTDTLWMTKYDTLYLPEYIHDTVYLHDTVFVGVDPVETTPAKLYQRDGRIVIEGAEGLRVQVFDAVGRMVNCVNASKSQKVKKSKSSEDSSTFRPFDSLTPNSAITTFEVPASGVYLVKIGDAPARRIVVIR